MLKRAWQTLWDLLDPAPPKPQAAIEPKPAPKPRAPKKTTKPASTTNLAPKTNPAPDSAQARYDAVVQTMLKRYGVRVRKWRTSMSGVAWCLKYNDGRITRLIESPKPKGPMSVAVFLHEIGHHAIGFDVYKPRCLEEYHAWMFALTQMEAEGLNITDAVRDRMYRSLHYAVAKAQRRRIKELPPELLPFVPKPPPRLRKSSAK